MMKLKITKKILIMFLIFLLILPNIYISSSSTKIENKSNKKTNFDEQKFDNKINFYMKLGNIPSLIGCIIKNNTIVWTKSYGYSNIETKEESTINTIYMVGSISKVVTATAIMQLYEKGYFKLDGNVDDYLPFSLKNPYYPKINITFRMLLAHQSSLSNPQPSMFIYFSLLNYPIEWIEEYVTPSGSLYAQNCWEKVPPGKEADYSSIGYELLSYLVQIISNQSFTDYCKKNIIEPLNMTNSSFILEELDRNLLAVPYLHFFGKYLSLPNYENKNYGAGGLQSNIVDISKFFIAHLNEGEYKNERILNKSTVDLMHSVQYEGSIDKIYRKYGLGWYIEQNTFSDEKYEGHSAAVLGGHCIMYYSKSRQAGIVYLTNQYSAVLRPFEVMARSKIQKLLFEKSETL